MEQETLTRGDRVNQVEGRGSRHGQKSSTSRRGENQILGASGVLRNI